MASFGDEDFGSDSSDDDYVPSDGEAVSEEEHSGEEENFTSQDGDAELGKSRRAKGTKKSKTDVPRKRTGGIKLEGEDVKEDNSTGDREADTYNKELAEHIEKEKVVKKEEDEKKKADALWADFMKDAGGPKPKSKPVSSGLGSLTAVASKPAQSKPNTESTSEASSAPKPTSSSIGKVTITKEYDFAGETIKITKEVDADSKEAKAELKKQSDEPVKAPTAGPSIPGLSGLGKRPGGGLGSVLGKIGKKAKMGTLEKSKIDWESFKQEKKIDEELKIHNRGKDGYLEKQDFLDRTDQRQFEIERAMRLGLNSSKR